MSNFDRAVEALNDVDVLYGALVSNEDYAIVLQGRGLLAPDEEAYQYGVAYTGLNHGERHIEWVEPTGDAELDKDILQRIVKSCEKWGQFPKVVRRRVSPPEAVNEAI